MLQANTENQLKGQGVQCQYKAKAAETQLGSQQYRREEVTVVRTHNYAELQIFAGVREIWGVKRESGRLRCRFSYLLLTVSSYYISMISLHNAVTCLL